MFWGFTYEPRYKLYCDGKEEGVCNGVKCSLCGHEFIEEQGQAACKSCLMAKGCKLIRCPNCGFETPAVPKWLKRLERKNRKDQL